MIAADSDSNFKDQMITHNSLLKKITKIHYLRQHLSIFFTLQYFDCMSY